MIIGNLPYGTSDNAFSPVIYIVSSDERFSDMLVCELMFSGLHAKRKDISDGIGTCDVLLWDLDSSPLPADHEPLSTKIICWTRRDNDFPKGENVTVLRRPFLVSELLELLGGAGFAVGKAFSMGVGGVRDAKESRQVNDEITVRANGRVYVGDTEVHLTPNEFTVFYCLFKKRGSPVSRHELALAIGAELRPATVDVHICRLREKLEGESGKKIIITLRGRGYALRGNK